MPRRRSIHDRLITGGMAAFYRIVCGKSAPDGSLIHISRGEALDMALAPHYSSEEESDRAEHKRTVSEISGTMRGRVASQWFPPGAPYPPKLSPLIERLLAIRRQPVGWWRKMQKHIRRSRY